MSGSAKGTHPFALALLNKRDPEQVARRFHDHYERLAPMFGYKTRDESAKPWEEVPEQNRLLMQETVRRVLADLAALADPPEQQEREICPQCGHPLNLKPDRSCHSAPEPQADSVEQERRAYRIPVCPGCEAQLDRGQPTCYECGSRVRNPKWVEVIAAEQERPDPERVVVEVSRASARAVLNDLVKRYGIGPLNLWHRDLALFCGALDAALSEPQQGAQTGGEER